MKNILILIIGIILNNISGYSQKYEPFIGKNKQWKYFQELHYTGNGFINYVEKGFFRGDTILNDTTYSKFYMQMEQPNLESEWLAYFFREDTIKQKVWINDFSFNQTALVYDFELEKGDTFNIYLVGNIFSKHYVIDVDTFYTENKKLKRIIFDDSTTWIEGIGCVTGRKNSSEGELLCVREGNSLLYLSPNFNNCDTIFENGLSDDIKYNTYKNLLNSYVYPNPVISCSILKVESNLHEEFEIEIYDYLGILIRKDKFYNDYPIGSLNLRGGTYIYRIFNKKGNVGLNKIIVL